MIFLSASEAYCWAQRVLSPFRNGRAYDPDPEQFRGGTGHMGAIITAIAIDSRAERACRGAKGCPKYSRECFLAWWLPDPTVFHAERSLAETRRIEECVDRFYILLRDAGLVE